MSVRTYTGPEFVTQLASKTRSPVLMIQTDGSGASSLRYQDITGVPSDVQDTLWNDGIAFVTFDALSEAHAAFETLSENWPAAGSTTLAITAVLGLPHQKSRIFQQIPGFPPTYNLAA